jgi:hypothetical protein
MHFSFILLPVDLRNVSNGQSGPKYSRKHNLAERSLPVRNAPVVHRSRRPSFNYSVRHFLKVSFVFDGSPRSIRSIQDRGGEATIPSEVVNIAKNLISSEVILFPKASSCALSAAFWVIISGAMLFYFGMLIATV